MHLSHSGLKPVEANEVTSVLIPGMVGSKDAGC